MEAWDNQKNGKDEATESATAHGRIVQHGEVVISEQLLLWLAGGKACFRVFPLMISGEREPRTFGMQTSSSFRVSRFINRRTMRTAAKVRRDSEESVSVAQLIEGLGFAAQVLGANCRSNWFFDRATPSVGRRRACRAQR